jgi:hypothetical protein
MKGWRLVLSAACALACVHGSLACGRSAKQEATRLVEAVDRFRRADNRQKVAAATAVSAAGCTDPEVCDARGACVAAVDATSRALALKDEVSRAVDDLAAKKLKPEDPVAQALPGKLDEAEALLHEGRAKMPACEDRITNLRIKYGL